MQYKLTGILVIFCCHFRPIDNIHFPAMIINKNTQNSIENSADNPIAMPNGGSSSVQVHDRPSKIDG